jgi:quinol-cytochrome oxidoreductase complex cytochrome b subunit
LLVVLGALRLEKKRREKEGIEATSPAERQNNDHRTSTKTRWFGASQLAGGFAMLGLGAYIFCLLIGLLLSLIVPDVVERMWPDWFFLAIKDFVGIPMSVGAGVGFVTARDPDPSSIKPSDLLRGDSHWD